MNDQEQALVHAIVDALRPETMTLRRALSMIERAEEHATQIGVPMVMTVVDEGGNPVAQHRMDNALLGSIEISASKAYTALALRMPTDEAARLVQPGQPLYGLPDAGQRRLCVFGGGYPVMHNGRCIGGLGVSGGSVEQDMQVAKAALL